MKRFIFITFLYISIPVFFYASSRKDSEITAERILLPVPADPETRKILTNAVQSALENGVDESAIARFVEVGSEAGRDPEELAFYLHRSAELHAGGVPAELLMNSILEGIAKDVPGQIIKSSLEPITDRLLFCTDTAREHFPRRAREANVELLANGLFQAMSLGFSKGDIGVLSREIKRNGKSPSYFVRALEVAMETANLGIQNSSTLMLLIEAVKNGLNTAEVAALPQILLMSGQKTFTEDDLRSMVLSARKSSVSPSEGDTETTKGGSSSGSDTGGNGGPSVQPGGGSGSRSRR